jgi:hypothetical protein
VQHSANADQSLIGLGELQGGFTRMRRSSYGLFLSWALTLSNTLRVAAYVPTLRAVCLAGDSSQCSIWTWIALAGSNLAMAAWCFEECGRRLNAMVVTNLANVGLCLGTISVIAWYRP